MRSTHKVREGRRGGNAVLLPPEAGGDNPQSSIRALSRIAAFAVVVAVAAVVFAFLTVSGSQHELNALKAGSTPGIIAKGAIPKNTTITADLVEKIDIPTTYLSAGCITELTEAIGKTTIADIPAKGQINTDFLAGQNNTSALAAAIDPDTLAASVTVDAETGLAGLLRQDDRVDVLAEGKPIIENARVVALDSDLSSAPPEYSTVTLQVSLADAQALQTAQMNDPVRLILRSSAEARP